MDRDFIEYDRLRPEFKDNWPVARILAFHNVCAWYCNKCEDCCSHDHDSNCSECHTNKTKREVEEDLNEYAKFVDKSYPELSGKLLKSFMSDKEFCDPELENLVKPKLKSPEFFDAETAKKRVGQVRKSKLNSDLDYIYSKISEGIKKGCDVINIDLSLGSTTSDLIEFLEKKGFEVSVFTGSQMDPCCQLTVKFK